MLGESRIVSCSCARNIREGALPNVLVGAVLRWRSESPALSASPERVGTRPFSCPRAGSIAFNNSPARRLALALREPRIVSGRLARNIRDGTVPNVLVGALLGLYRLQQLTGPPYGSSLDAVCLLAQAAVLGVGRKFFDGVEC